MRTNGTYNTRRELEESVRKDYFVNKISSHKIAEMEGICQGTAMHIIDCTPQHIIENYGKIKNNHTS